MCNQIRRYRQLKAISITKIMSERIATQLAYNCHPHHPEFHNSIHATMKGNTKDISRPTSMRRLVDGRLDALPADALAAALLRAQERAVRALLAVHAQEARQRVRRLRWAYRRCGRRIRGRRWLEVGQERQY